MSLRLVQVPTREIRPGPAFPFDKNPYPSCNELPLFQDIHWEYHASISPAIQVAFGQASSPLLLILIWGIAFLVLLLITAAAARRILGRRERRGHDCRMECVCVCV